jgi:hypothetical protein
MNLGLKTPQKYPTYKDKSATVAYPAGLTNFGDAFEGDTAADHLVHMVPSKVRCFFSCLRNSVGNVMYWISTLAWELG